jgi:hypothetical protein
MSSDDNESFTKHKERTYEGNAPAITCDAYETVCMLAILYASQASEGVESMYVRRSVSPRHCQVHLRQQCPIDQTLIHLSDEIVETRRVLGRNNQNMQS